MDVSRDNHWNEALSRVHSVWMGFDRESVSALVFKTPLRYTTLRCQPLALASDQTLRVREFRGGERAEPPLDKQFTTVLLSDRTKTVVFRRGLG